MACLLNSKRFMNPTKVTNPIRVVASSKSALFLASNVILITLIKE